MKHYFTSHTVRQLVDLRGDLLKTLRNPQCEPLTVPIMETIRQINSELEKRCITPLKKLK